MMKTAVAAASTSLEAVSDEASNDGENMGHHPAISTTRASAKAKVVASWADRRRQSAAASSSAKKSSISNGTTTAPAAQRHEQGRLSLCRILKHTWEQASLDLARALDPSSNKSENHATWKSSSQNHDHQVFPSVLPILQAAAVASELETFQSNNNYNDNSIALQVLPAGYDMDRAIARCAETRHRAFLLLDLASIVKSHVNVTRIFQHQVHLQYAVHHNRDLTLLELFSRLRVGLRCRSSLDVQQVLNKNNNNSMLVDDMGTTPKPNGYIRRILQACREQHERPRFAVDGPEEVRRIHQVLRIVEERYRKSCDSSNGNHDDNISKLPSLDFVLRLDHQQVDPKQTWKALVQSTQENATDLCHRLVGISLDVFSENMSTEKREEDEISYLASLRFTIDELCNIISSKLHDDSAEVQIDVTGLTASQSAAVTRWLTQLGRSYLVTVDASEMLMANVGALCTRIIGVKDDASNNTRHYYIDDGCYGSLYSHSCAATDFMPLPLFSVRNHNPEAVVNSTVWGPTCDGLDRVCRNVPLPRMQVDDWMVFPNMGCGGGLSTAFNGFDPPDTAYCVLGYFRQSNTLS